jgi:hypothetical protein
VTAQSLSSWPLSEAEQAFLWDLELPATRVALVINGSRLVILTLILQDTALLQIQ